MSIIVPTILAGEAHGFRTQLERIEGFASRVQIDLADGEFAPSKTIDPVQIYWPDTIKADIHLMYKNPDKILDGLILLKPQLVIIHFEADTNIFENFTKLENASIKKGVALLMETKPIDAKDVIEQADHVLIFAGQLGYFGGEANLEMLEKVKEIRDIKPDIEIGWDGGASNQNVKQLSDKGINVINVGSYIQRSQSPQHAYAILESIITG